MNPVTAKYWAFISYSHRDERTACALQRALETYRLPRSLVGTRTAVGVVPARVAPVFRDRDELQVGTDLKFLVHDALAQSRYLIVVCSPDSARSLWVNQEIIEFKKLNGESRVLAVIAAGEPFASDAAGRGDEECFPEALRAALASDGTATGDALEPIAADLRPQGDGLRRATLKLIAGMVGVGADQLIRREGRRRMRQLAIITVASVLGMAAMGVLAVTAIHARDEAQLQRNKAEDLLEFMLGDLRKKLDRVGRLDVLDSVGEKALAYYASQDTGPLDANALGRKCRALHLIGEIREKQGQLDAAQNAFQKAADSTAQLLALAPQDSQRIYDHAQSVYWVGFLAWRRGELPRAERAFQNYLSLAKQLTALDSKNTDWQAEEAYANENIGVVYLESSRRPTEALDAFTRTRVIWQRLLPADPARALELANTIGWIAKAYEAQGNFDRAVEAQREKEHVLESVPDATSNQQVHSNLLTINGELARLELTLDRPAASQAYALTAVKLANELATLDPQNNSWLEQLYQAEAILAEAQLAAGDRAAARESAQRALAGSLKLITLNHEMAAWQVTLRGRALYVATLLAGDEERRQRIEDLKNYLVNIHQFTTADHVMDQTRDLVVARNQLLLGDLLAREGQRAEAVTHWRSVVTLVQVLAAHGNLDALTALAAAKLRLGAVAEAKVLARQIESTTYRHPAYADLVRMLADDAGSSVAPTQK